MVLPGRREEVAMASTSKSVAYPQPLAKYEDVKVNPRLFMATLEKLHATMGTKFMIPIIGGKELDLHRLFVEVTSRGGLEKIIRERRWKEVTAVFSFPSTATNASFVLRKYYVLLLHHYEQIYLFKAQSWTPTSDESMQSSSATPIPAQGSVEPEVHLAASQPRENMQSQTGSVIGVIDGKFEDGYLVTVMIGNEKLKGVLYESTHNYSAAPQNLSCYQVLAPAAPAIQRRKRRKKSEIKKRDPSHPKPNRSGYNFFFAEQHGKLKPLYPGKDRQISRMIGERWSKLKENEKGVYQEKALKDKERYRAEMEYYREKQRTGQVISNAVPLQQLPPEPSTDTAEVEDKTEAEGGNSEHTMETDSVDSSDRDLSNDDTANDDFEIERSSREDGNVMVEEEGFKLRKGAEEDVGECSQNSIDVEMRVEKESVQEGDH